MSDGNNILQSTAPGAVTIYQPQTHYLMPALGVEQALERRDRVVAFVKAAMKENIDFGVVPGTDKPTLLKPGAERLNTYFGLTFRPVIIERTEDWDGIAHGGEPFFYYLIRGQLWRGDVLIAEADGSCNSRESRYRWRWVGEEDLPPGANKATLKARGGRVSEFAFAVDKAETGGKYGKPAAYWQRFKDAISAGTAAKVQKKTNAGKLLDAWEIDTTVYRVPNDDIASQVNTILKIGEKRALVAATLLAVNASEFFTQDVEDMEPGTFNDSAYTIGRPSNGPAWTPETVKTGEEPAPAGNGHDAAPEPAAPAHSVHTRELEEAKEQAKAQTQTAVTNGKSKPKSAAVKTAAWNAAAKALAAEEVYYQKNGAPDFFHMLGVAAKQGYTEITDANLLDVVRELRVYAGDQAALKAAETEQSQVPAESPAGDDLPF